MADFTAKHAWISDLVARSQKCIIIFGNLNAPEIKSRQYLN